MTRRRRYLLIYLFSAVTGWAAAHFTVGNAGSVALQAAIGEGRLRISTGERESAGKKMASLSGKPVADQAGIIARWWEIDSIAEIRHLYNLLKQVPRDLRDDARDVLLGRWAMLDPDTLLLAAVREKEGDARGAMLRAFSLHWAAGRSREEITGILISTVGDMRKFIPEAPAGGRFRPEEAFGSGRRWVEYFGLDPQVGMDLEERLNFKLPPEGYLTMFSALARSDPQAARQRLSLITDPATRRAATAGIASQLALTDPASALAMCEKGDRELISAITPGYFRHLLALPPEEAWKKAGEFAERFAIGGGNGMVQFLQRMAARDPEGLRSWMASRPAQQREYGEFIYGLSGGPAADPVYQEFLLNASITSMRLAGAITSGFQNQTQGIGPTLQWLAQTNRPDLQMTAADAMLSRLDEGFDGTLEESRQLLSMLGAASLPPDARNKLMPDEAREQRGKGIATVVAGQWPASAVLLDQLNASARETVLPGFISGAAVHDARRAADLLAAEPDNPAALEATAGLAQVWSSSDLPAAREWMRTLTGERRARAEATLRPVLEQWGLEP